MPAAAIKTTGDLRGFLAEVITGVRDGTVDPQRATAISKIASQINDSFATETQTALIALKLGLEGKPIGDMKLLGAPQAEPAQRVIEHAPAEAPTPNAEPSPPAPKVVVELAPANSKIFCTQCDRTVSASEGERCTSAFCKARAA